MGLIGENGENEHVESTIVGAVCMVGDDELVVVSVM